MRKNFLVIGLGRFGTSTATMLTKLGHQVLAVDRRADHVNSVKDDVTHAVQADTTDEHVIEQLGVNNFDCVVICIGDDIRASALTTVLCRENGAKRIVCKAQDLLHKLLLLKIGADTVVMPELDGGARLARSLVSQGVLDSLDLSEEYSINEVMVPESWVGKSLIELNARTRYGVTVVAIRRDEHVNANVDPHAPLLAGDTLFAIGSNKAFEALR